MGHSSCRKQVASQPQAGSQTCTSASRCFATASWFCCTSASGCFATASWLSCHSPAVTAACCSPCCKRRASTASRRSTFFLAHGSQQLSQAGASQPQAGSQHIRKQVLRNRKLVRSTAASGCFTTASWFRCTSASRSFASTSWFARRCITAPGVTTAAGTATALAHRASDPKGQTQSFGCRCCNQERGPLSLLSASLEPRLPSQFRGLFFVMIGDDSTCDECFRLEVHSADEVAGEHTSKSLDEHKRVGCGTPGPPTSFSSSISSLCEHQNRPSDWAPPGSHNGRFIVSEHQQDSDIRCQSLWVHRHQGK